MRVALAILMCGGLATSAGCTRTSDGTVVPMMPLRPITLPSPPVIKLGEWPSFRRQPQRQQQAVAQFPAAPRQPVQVATVQPIKPRPALKSARAKPARVAVMRPAVKAPSTASGKMTCRNETQAGGRVKFVCE